jgi:RNA polymerase sigma-70 factor (ECF subfamily)
MSEASTATAAIPTDDELLAEVGHGSREALATLVDRHHAWLLRTTTWLAHDPDAGHDLAQECFLRLVKAAGRWEGRAALRTWLATVARNLAIDAGRRAWSRRETLPADAAATGPAPDELAARAERTDRLRAVLAELALEEREALVLSEMAGLTQDEIARASGVPPGTVASRKHRAVRKVRALWAARWKEDEA